ncbi:MAG TPA: TonB-dependent receptor [Steroidobacteraceae bacterium]|nr:TonB-dependent receptor [Steroidobacteraceae bacterium]
MQRSRVRKLKRAGTPAPTLSAHVLLKRAPIAAAVFAAIPPLYAADESGELEQVVVTAEKRTENLQDVPISITALDTKSLEQLHIEDFNDYVKYLPSVSFQASSAGGGASGPGFTRIFMRGVSSGDNGNHSGPLPTVGVYLDEQPITTIQGPVDLHVYDVERIEALAGPQGTLYGASSLAGTVRIITNKPDPSAFKAGYDLELMTTKGQPGFIAEGFVNIPLSPSAAIRIVGWSEHDGGYINNVPGTFTYASSGNLCIGNNPPPAGCQPTLVSPKNDFNSLDLYGARMALKVNLNDNWTITPTLMGQEDRSGGMFAYDPAVGNFDTTRFYPDTIKDKWYQIGLTVQGKIGNLELTYAGAFLHRNDYTSADYADYTLYYDKVYGSGVCFFQGANQPNGTNVCNAAGPFYNPTQYILASDGYTKNSQELRIATPKESSVRFVGGLYYERQQHDIKQDYVIDDLPTYNSVTGWGQTLWLTLQERVDRDYAIFGELSWDIVKTLTFTVGDRFFKYDNSLTGFYGFGLNNPIYNSATGEQSCFLGPIVAGTPCTDLANSVSATSNIPKFNLTYRIGDDALVYATYSKGYRPGGINRRTQAPPLPPLATYAPDYLQNYEIGFKTSWFHNHLRFNGAFFWDNWDNFQFSFLGQNSFTIVRNATGAAARIKGVELQLDWAPVQGLAINAGVTGLQAVMANDFCVTTDSNGVPLPLTTCPLQNAVPAGTLLPSVPKWKGDLTIRYSWPMGDYTGHVQLSGDYVTQETQALPPAWATLLGNTPAYGLVDFSGGIDHSNFFANLVVSNLFNKEAQYYRYSECPTYSPFITGTPTTLGAPLCGQRPHVGVATPITVGVQFGQRF